MGELSIPNAIGDITPEWLSAALSTADAPVSVTAIDVEPIGMGLGVMALLYRLTPSYAGVAGPASVVVKLASLHEQTRQIARGYGFYGRETAIYNHLSDELSLPSAHCWFAAHDPESDDFVVVMEDLGHLRVCSQLDGCSVDDARTVVRQIARLHGEWWMDDRLLSLPFMESAGNPPYPQFHAQSTKDAWPVFVEKFGEHLTPAFTDLGERWPEIGPPIMEMNNDEPWTLSHGDLRLDNIFFHDTDAASVVDFQITFRGGAAFDLAYFLCQSLTVDNRRAHQDELLRLYHDGLLAQGVTNYSWDQFLVDYRRSVLFGFCYPMTGGASCDLVNDRAVELMTTMLQRSMAAIEDIDAFAVAPDLA